jgi:threonine/homoserine/homoserine lactone efflux protein
MTFITWAALLVAAFAICSTPGPNMLHVLTRSIQLGAKRSMPTMAGCVSGLITILAASAAGLHLILDAVPALFAVIKYGGVAYLVFLGVKAWRSASTPIVFDTSNAPLVIAPARQFWTAFAVGVSNPKLLLFGAAFMPQFINANFPQAGQYAMIVATFAACEVFWYAVYGVSGRTISSKLREPRWNALFNRLTGGLFVGFGLAMLGAS